MSTETVDCCIVGAGPGGMMLALLLARTGHSVILLEARQDFDRDFRGDTVHASTLETLDHLGLADEALDLPHVKMRSVTLHTPERTLDLVHFDRLPTRFPYVAVMPQSSFLDWLCRKAEACPNFTCLRGAAAQALLEDGRRITGVRYRAGADHNIHATLTVAADGRFSRMRKLAGLSAQSSAPPMDVCWFRLPRRERDGHETGGFFVAHGRMLVCIPRTGEWQIGYVFPKGDFAQLKSQGIDALRKGISDAAPWLSDRIDALKDFTELHLLTVRGDCLVKWYRPGFLAIGDAAHVMTPVGGVGINMAVSDAVAAANVLADPATLPLRNRTLTESHLAEIQSRRMRATRITQAVQDRIQDQIVKRALRNQPFALPLPVRLALAIPGLRDIPARLFALGLPRTRLAV
ncbi:MAG: FAD-dependent oxidoreductase [Pseudomonadales bacterium]